MPPWWTLLAGIQEAGTIDPNKVADVLASGLEFDTPGGASMMVSRPDFGNSRTVDYINDAPIKQIVGGSIKQIGTMSAQQAYDYCKEIYGW